MYQEEYNALVDKAHKLRQIERALKPLLNIDHPLSGIGAESSTAICPCNDCEYASDSGCSFDYPEYGTMDAVDCVMYQVRKE